VEEVEVVEDQRKTATANSTTDPTKVKKLKASRSRPGATPTPIVQMVGAARNGPTRRVEAEGGRARNGPRSSTTNQGLSAGPESPKIVKAVTTQHQQKRHRRPGPKGDKLPKTSHNSHIRIQTRAESRGRKSSAVSQKGSPNQRRNWSWQDVWKRFRWKIMMT